MLPLIFDVGKIARRNKQRVGRLIPGFFLLCAPSFDCCTIRLEVDFRNRALFFFALLDIFNHPILHSTVPLSFEICLDYSMQ